MPADPSALLDEIASLLALRPGDDGVERIDETLTVGYAQAMALEAERWRLERRIAEIAGETEDVGEIADLARRMTAADGEISRLRALLRSLRDHARELRLAAEPI